MVVQCVTNIKYKMEKQNKISKYGVQTLEKHHFALSQFISFVDPVALLSHFHRKKCVRKCLAHTSNSLVKQGRKSLFSVIINSHLKIRLCSFNRVSQAHTG